MKPRVFISSNYYQNIYPIISENNELNQYFESKMEYTIYLLISDVLF